MRTRREILRRQLHTRLKAKSNASAAEEPLEEIRLAEQDLTELLSDEPTNDARHPLEELKRDWEQGEQPMTFKIQVQTGAARTRLCACRKRHIKH